LTPDEGGAAVGTIFSPSTAASRVGERFGTAPAAARPGTVLPVAGYAGVLATAAQAAPMTHAAPTLAAVRKDDARVPCPRGRTR
jgi:hypothetical protein